MPDTSVVPDTPTVPDESEDADNAASADSGFLIDDNGIIYGVSDPALAITEGMLRIPSEGCSGIAAGTFASGFPSVIEVSIPANITSIEAGAFTGLVNAEWYTVEQNSVFSEKMGVLLSEGGTCILAFPSGRTGKYKVPAGITCFAENAFLDAHISSVDVSACPAEMSVSVPDRIEVIRREASESDLS